MTHTTENKRTAPTILTLIICLGTLPILFGATGCSTSNPDSSGRLETTVDLLRTGPSTRPTLDTDAYGIGHGLNGERWNIESFE